MTEQKLWHEPSNVMPPIHKPLLIAFRRSSKWLYFVAKWTGKRWLEVNPDQPNEQFSNPDYWQEIEAPP
jgi:hypothetical protein